MPFIGRKIDIGIGKETTRGTGVAPSFWIPKIDATVEDKSESAIDESSIGVIEDSIGSEVIKKWSEGDIVGNVRDKSIGLVLLSALGKVTSSIIGTGPAYQHTFEILQSAVHQSLTIGMKNLVQQLRYTLAVINSLELRFELAKFVEFTAGFMAKAGVGASDTVSYATENQFLAHHIEVKTAANLAGLAGAAPIKIKNATLNIAKNAEADDVLGSIEPVNYFNKQVEITGSMELLFEDVTYKNLFLNGTAQALRIDVKNSNVDLGGGVNPQITIDLAKVQFPEWTREGGLNDIIKQTINFKGFYSKTDAQALKIVLINTQTSY